MVQDVVINVNNVSMCFSKQSEKIDSLKEFFIKSIHNNVHTDIFYALKNVSFKIRKGESWGFIGMNGAGKSTMLKVIAGILNPTSGSVDIHGKIAPMIELAAGFDGELTARENIYLNGLMLRMSRVEIEELFYDIVKFAELENFLDTPVKNFSSGMLARLGFSLATCKRPDILIVDEALSVGDFKFQEKCHRRIKELLKKETTFLFVSHSADEVKAMCDYVIWLDKGEVKMIGKSEEVCNVYINQ